MGVMEVLTLLLVIFAALSYIASSTAQSVGCLFFISFFH